MLRSLGSRPSAAVTAAKKAKNDKQRALNTAKKTFDDLNKKFGENLPAGSTDGYKQSRLQSIFK